MNGSWEKIYVFALNILLASQIRIWDGFHRKRSRPHSLSYCLLPTAPPTVQEVNAKVMFRIERRKKTQRKRFSIRRKVLPASKATRTLPRAGGQLPEPQVPALRFIINIEICSFARYYIPNSRMLCFLPKNSSSPYQGNFCFINIFGTPQKY